MHVRITDVCPRFEWVVVVCRSLEDQTLVLVPLFDVEELRFQGIIVAHLVARDVVKPALSVGVAVVAMFVAVSGGFHPKRAVGMEKFDVGPFVVAAPPPSTIFLTVATD